jgi:hypothetical protein
MIDITESLALSSDEYNWIAHKRYIGKDKYGNEVVKYQAKRYYSSIEAFVKSEVNRIMRLSDYKTAADLLDIQDNALSAISNALNIDIQHEYKVTRQ